VRDFLFVFLILSSFGLLLQELWDAFIRKKGKNPVTERTGAKENFLKLIAATQSKKNQFKFISFLYLFTSFYRPTSQEIVVRLSEIGETSVGQLKVKKPRVTFGDIDLFLTEFKSS